MNNKYTKIISDLHYPLWLLKDFMWMIKLPIISFILAVPTIIISIYMYLKTNGKSKLENQMVLAWLCANTTWMCSEQFEMPVLWLSYLFFIVGIITLIFYIPYLFLQNNSE
jgi:hypothetical protein